METSISKLKGLLKKDYKITDMFYYHGENEEPYSQVILINKDKLVQIEAEGEEAFELITLANNVRKK